MDEKEDVGASEMCRDICEMCRENESTIWCQDCQSNICCKCDELIHRISINTKHTRYSQKEKHRTDNNLVCKVHKGKLLDYYCLDDETFVCDRCCIIGEHKHHNCDLYSNVVHNRKAELRLQLNDLQKAMDNVTSLAEKVCTNLDALTDDNDCCVEDSSDAMNIQTTMNSYFLSASHAKIKVNHAFDELEKAVSCRRNFLLTEIDKRVADKEKLLRNQLDMLNSKISSAHSVMHDVEEMLNACDASGVKDDSCSACLDKTSPNEMFSVVAIQSQITYINRLQHCIF